MSQAERLEILFADEEQSGFFDGGDGSRIVAAVENGEFGDGTAGTVNAQHLLASAGRSLEDADVAGLDHVHAGARVAFGEDHYSGGEFAGYGALGKESQFALGESA